MWLKAIVSYNSATDNNSNCVTYHILAKLFRRQDKESWTKLFKSSNSVSIVYVYVIQLSRVV